MRGVEKVCLSDRDIMRKYRVNSSAGVSYQREQFDCDGFVIQWRGPNGKGRAFGVSKKDSMVSNYQLVKMFMGSVNGS